MPDTPVSRKRSSPKLAPNRLAVDGAVKPINESKAEEFAPESPPDERC